MRATGLAAVVFSAALALGACGSDSDDKASTTGDTDTTAAADTNDTSDAMTGGGGEAGTAIAIKDFKFAPETLKAKVGDKITVTNKDPAVHTLTAKDKSFDTGNLEQNADGTITVSKAGTFEYFCSIHDYMTGTIEVE